MPTLQGLKLVGGTGVSFTVPDGSPHVGESTVWRDRQSSGTVELWFLGATFVFQRTGGANGVYSLQSGASPNAAEISDANSNWVDGTNFYLSAAFSPFPRGLPPTNGYVYAVRVSDTGQNIAFADFLAVSGNSDVSSFYLRFLNQPSSSFTFTVRLYYQHQ